MERSYKTLIVGGGIIGSSIAMALSEQGANEIGVVDCDLGGKWGSTERNAGGVRATWGEQVNIDLSRESITFYEEIASEVGFQQKGYLWLHKETKWQQVLKWIKQQNRSGVLTEQLSLKEVRRLFPFLNRLDDVFAATFSPKDGLINPNLLKKYYRSHASASNVDWIDHYAVESVSTQGRKVQSVLLREIPSEDAIEQFLTHQTLPKEGRAIAVKVGTLINAAGSWAPRLALLYGKQIPSIPVRRQVTFIRCHEIDLSPHGMIVDSSGVYFHHEGGNILAGFSLPSEPSGYRFKYDGSDFFQGEIWPRLIERSSLFERLRMIGGWAGLYAVSPDKSAIIGSVEGIENLYEAHSFSGHGVMQSYAVGQSLAELILQGQYHMIDLSVLSGKRFNKGRLILEEMHV